MTLTEGRDESMNIAPENLVKGSVALLILYPISAVLVWSYLGADDYYGVMAALLVANAGAALLVGLAFSLPEYRHHTSKVLRLTVSSVGVACALASAIFWMVDEVDHIWLRLVIISPIAVIFLLLMLFVNRVDNAGTQREDRD